MDILTTIKKIAKENFNIAELRPMQIKVITNILENYEEKKANRLLVLLQTGGGKSLCFLLPSIIVEGLTVIVYPLLALMNDQKRRLDELNINSEIIEGGQTKEKRSSIFQSIRSKKIKILIINPEALLNESVMESLREFYIALFVIDEAHTICEWGLSFRPAYKELGEKINSLHINQVLAFTATADKKTLKALEEYLFFFKDYTTIRGGVDRKNIIYHLRFSLSKDREINQILSEKDKRPAIVFCKSRKDTRNAYHNFREYNNNECYYYHAGLSKLEKNKIEKEFFKSNNAVLFSTIAFGLGMDKKNVRSVIHYSIVNTNVLSFLQESGRGGRDGLISHSIVLIGKEEIKELNSTSYPNKKNKKNSCNDFDLLKIYTSNNCIRNELCKYMGESIESCSGCDICNQAVIHSFDGLRELINLLFFHPFLYSVKDATNTLKGDKELNIGCCNYSLLSQWDTQDIKKLIKNCINLHLIFIKKNKIAINYFQFYSLKHKNII